MNRLNKRDYVGVRCTKGLTLACAEDIFSGVAQMRWGLSTRLISRMLISLGAIFQKRRSGNQT